MLRIPQVLDAPALSRIHGWLEEGEFVDGRRSARGFGPEAKQNLVWHREGDPIERLCVEALSENALFQAYVLPCRFAPPMVNRYDPGMQYGAHLDSALMGRSPTMRSDASVTIFLSGPEDYEGGELVVTSRVGEARVKLPAGWALVYPSDTLHRIEPVRSGRRIVVVTWAQSFIRDPQIREMLFDLRRALDAVEAAGAAPETLNLLRKTHTNLYRKFAET
jgi:PKHD-type hydroxylase